MLKKDDPFTKDLEKRKERVRDKTDARDAKDQLQVSVKANKMQFHFRLQYRQC